MPNLIEECIKSYIDDMLIGVYNNETIRGYYQERLDRHFQPLAAAVEKLVEAAEEMMGPYPSSASHRKAKRSIAILKGTDYEE